METLIEEQTTERLLIFTRDSEIDRITADAKSRAALLNRLLAFGLDKEQIDLSSRSQDTIERFIFDKHVKQNPAYAKLLKVAEVKPVYSQENHDLRFALEAWRSYSSSDRSGNKYSNLKFDAQWSIDEEHLEQECIVRGHKYYVSGDQLQELHDLEIMRDLLQKYDAYPGQVFACQFLDRRFTCDSSLSCNALPKSKYMIKVSHFRNRG